MVRERQQVYICKADNPLDLYTHSSYGWTLEALQRRFFDKEGIALRPYATGHERYETSRAENVILAPGGDGIDILVYSLADSMDLGWRGWSVERKDRRRLVEEFLGNEMFIPYRNGKRNGMAVVRPRGPKVIFVDESRTKNKRQPTAKQYAKIVACYGALPRILHEDTGQEIFFDPGTAKPEPTPKHPEDDDLAMA